MSSDLLLTFTELQAFIQKHNIIERSHLAFLDNLSSLREDNHDCAIDNILSLDDANWQLHECAIRFNIDWPGEKLGYVSVSFDAFVLGRKYGVYRVLYTTDAELFDDSFFAE